MHDNKKAVLKYRFNEEEFMFLKEALNHVENIQNQLDFKKKFYLLVLYFQLSVVTE